MGRAQRLGFALCRILPVQPAPHADFFEAWLGRGNAAEMHYLERNIEKRRHPARCAHLWVRDSRRRGRAALPARRGLRIRLPDR